jgi:hypothetical protein
LFGDGRPRGELDFAFAVGEPQVDGVVERAGGDEDADGDGFAGAGDSADEDAVGV